MKRGGTLLAVAALLVLTGCSAPEVKEPVESGELPTASATAAPKAMSLKSSVEEPEASASADEEFYFKTFDLWKSEGRPLPSNEELLAAGYAFCKKLDGGASALSTNAIEGSTKDAIDLNQYVRGSAVSALCPDHL